MAVRDYNPHLGHKDEVVREYMGLARSIARRFRWAVTPGIGMDDIEAEAYMALVQAFNRYAGGDATFKTFAFRKIRWALCDYIRKKRPAAFVPDRILQLAGRIRRDGLYSDSAEQVAAVIGCSIEMAERALLCLRTGANLVGDSLDKPFEYEESGPRTPADLLEALVDDSETIVSEFLRQLPKQEKAFVQSRMAGERIERPALLKSVQDKLVPFLELRKEDIAQMSVDLTKEKYQALKNEQLSDTAIRTQFNLGEWKFNQLKREWGLIDSIKSAAAAGKKSKTTPKKNAPIGSAPAITGSTIERNWQSEYEVLLAKHQAMNSQYEAEVARLSEEIAVLKAALKFYLITEVRPC